jgi:hypothetical protein
MTDTTLTADSTVDLDATIDGYLAAWNTTTRRNGRRSSSGCGRPTPG